MTETPKEKLNNDLPDTSKDRIMTKIAAGFAALVLSVSGMALGSGATTLPAPAPEAPVKAAATTPAAPVKEQASKVQAPVQASGAAETKAAPTVKPVAPDASKTEVKPEVKTEVAPVKKTDDKAVQGAAATGAQTGAPVKTTTN